ncbi:MAG: hypothetical protein HKN92_03245 [Chitinophagales bacterium]|nr:hypothetical protein [Chitinophagales bacterium]
MKKNNIFLLVLSLALFLVSCQKDLDWTPSVLGPIVYTKANVKDLSDLKDKRATYYLPSFDLGFPENVPVTVPPLYIERLGPQTINISDYFIDVTIDTANITTSISNPFPIPIGAGTKVVMRDAEDTTQSSVIYDFMIDEDIPAGGQFSSITIFENSVVTSTVYLYLEDFQSPGDTNVIFTSEPAEFSMEIGFLSIENIRILTDQELKVEQTMNMSLSNSSDSTLESGMLHIYLDNELPVNMAFQMYFMDQNDVGIIDSMFDGKANVIAGTTDPVTGSKITSTEAQIDIPINKAKLDLWKTSGNIRAVFNVNTNGMPGSFVTAGNTLDMQMTIAGDLDLVFTFN